MASFDPLPDGVIIWTRWTPEDAGAATTAQIGWQVGLACASSVQVGPRPEPALQSAIATQVSEAKDFSSLAASGTFETNPQRDWTVAVDVTGLQPGKRYYYTFSTGKQHRCGGGGLGREGQQGHGLI